MRDAFICDYIRTPIGRYGGALAKCRPDDLAALVIKSLVDRNPDADWSKLDDVILGSANQAGEDNRNVARMAALLAGLPVEVPGMTLNRLCGSGLEAVSTAARAIKAGEADFMIAGGVESMSRAPFVLAKSSRAFERRIEIHDTTIGWRFINRKMQEEYGAEPMAETAENVAREFQISREDQDAFAARSQSRAAKAKENRRFVDEIISVEIPQRSSTPYIVSVDEHPRDTSLDALAKLQPITGTNGTITAGNASGINDGAAALIVASEQAIGKHGLTPRARICGSALAGVPPRIMGIGPVPASRKLMDRLGLTIDDIDVVELNEAFASQTLAVCRQLGLPDDASHVNPNGGAIALGHPLGMSGARLTLSAAEELQRTGGRFVLVTMCVGVGQGIALVIERV